MTIFGGHKGYWRMSLSNNMWCIYVENKTINIGDNQESSTVTKLRHSEEHASIFVSNLLMIPRFYL